MIRLLRGVRLSGTLLAVGLLFTLAWDLFLVRAEGTAGRVRPVGPEDGSVVGSRPVFRLEFDSAGDPDSRHPRFRVTLDDTRSGTRAYVFDQRRGKSGWASGEEGEVIFRPRKPLADGSYRWRAWIWDGVAWVPGDGVLSVRIDTVPPADVEGLTLDFDEGTDDVRLEWLPVTLDQAGRPEYVARYHVLRYERRAVFRGVRAHEIGATELPRFTDEKSPAKKRLLYYKVIAEDEAGNVADRPK